jgi:hypothetical protein
MATRPAADYCRNTRITEMKLVIALLNNAEAAMLVLDQERGTQHTYSQFHYQVFESVLGAFIAALDDATAPRPLSRIHVTSAPVGCGKTTCGIAYVAGLINSSAEFEEEEGYAPTALFVVEQTATRPEWSAVGHERSRTFIDEEIKETHVYDVHAADIQGARKESDRACQGCRAE